MPSQNITCTILPYGPTAVIPANNSIVNKLDVITLDFDEDVLYDGEALVTVMKQTIDEDDWFGSVILDTIAQVSIADNYEDYSQLLINVGNIDSAGTYVVVVPEGSIWAESNENKKIGEWTYTYNVDPDYWDPEWVVKASGTSQESPVEVIAGHIAYIGNGSIFIVIGYILPLYGAENKPFCCYNTHFITFKNNSILKRKLQWVFKLIILIYIIYIININLENFHKL